MQPPCACRSITVGAARFSKTPLVRVVEQVKDNIPRYFLRACTAMIIRLAPELKGRIPPPNYLVVQVRVDSEDWSYQMVEQHSGDAGTSM